MEIRAFLVVLLSVTALVIYQQWVQYHYGPRSTPVLWQKRNRERAVGPQSPWPEVKEPEIPSAPAESTVRDVRVETEHYVAVFTSMGARLKSFRLKHYRNSPDENSGLVEMIQSAPGLQYPLGLALYDSTTPFDDKALPYSVQGNNLRLSGDAKGTVVFRTRVRSGETLTKRFTFAGSSYAVGIVVSVEGSSQSAPAFVLLTSQGKGPTEDALFEGTLGFAGNKLIRVTPKSRENSDGFTGHLSWAGFDYTYFLSVLLPEGGEQKFVVKRTGPGQAVEIGAQLPAEGRSRYTLFIGPKEIDLLRAMGRGLDKSIDLGFFGFISLPLLYILHLFHRFTGSYGIDIIFLTMLVKLLMAPLTHRSYVSMRRMKMLQPQMERLKKKFKDNKERLSREITELYRQNKVNPLGGCLPMLLQMPVFWGLYRILRTPIEFRHAHFLWINDLSRPDWQSLPVALGGWGFGIPVLTLLMGASMLAQQWMSPAVEDPNRRSLALVTPLVFTVMFINFPAGLTIYWLANNLLTIGQQYLINRLDR